MARVVLFLPLGQPALLEHRVRDVPDVANHRPGAFDDVAVFATCALGPRLGLALGLLPEDPAIREDAQHGRNAPVDLVLALRRLAQQNEQDDAGHEVETGLGPVILQALAVGVDDHGGDVLHILDQIAIDADLLQGIEPCRIGARRVEFECSLAEKLVAKSAGQCPVFALDVEHQHRFVPGQQGRDHDPHTLAGPGRREHHHVFGPLVAQVLHLPLVLPGPEQHPTLVLVGRQDASLEHLIWQRPVGRAVEIIALAFGFPRAPEGQSDRQHKREEAADTHDEVGALEDCHNGRAEVEAVELPGPHQHVERKVDPGLQHRFTQCSSEPQRPSGVLGCGPAGQQHDHGEQAKPREDEARDVFLSLGDVIQPVCR